LKNKCNLNNNYAIHFSFISLAIRAWRRHSGKLSNRGP